MVAGIGDMSRTDQKLMRTRFMVVTGGSSMTEQIENPGVTKLENELVSDAAAQKRIERVA